MNICMRVFVESNIDNDYWVDYGPDGRFRERGSLTNTTSIDEGILQFINTLDYQPTIVPRDRHTVVYYLVNPVQIRENHNVIDED